MSGHALWAFPTRGLKFRPPVKAARFGIFELATSFPDSAPIF